MNVVSIGEVLWDVVGEQEYLGGAAFNFSANLARLRHQVSFVSAVGEDERGQRILDAMPLMGLTTRYVPRVGKYPTGVVSVSLDQTGHPDYIVHRPAAYDFSHLNEEDFAELFSQPVDWVYFGTLFSANSKAKDLTMRLLDAAAGIRRFYDVNLRPGCWQPSLVLELMSRATMVKLNSDEAAEVARIFGQPLESWEEFSRACKSRFGWEGLCITRGADGCALLLGDDYMEAGGYPVNAVDTVGAGDAFSAAFVHGVGRGWPASRTADFANRLAALVASRSGAFPLWTLAEVEALQQGPDCLSDSQSRHRETA